MLVLELASIEQELAQVDVAKRTYADALPERDEDALIVLRLATEPVTDFLNAPDQPTKPATVVLIGGSGCASSELC
ncbi:hypothetical protein ACVWY5_005672 [Bradyrhizobium sp. USDA 3256]